MNVSDRVLGYVGGELASGKDINLDTTLMGIIDSTAIMEIVVWIESTFAFSVEIDAITPENFGSCRLISEFVEKNRAN